MILTLLLLISEKGYTQYSGSGTFTKITSLASLTDGYYVIAYGTTFAMNSTNAGTFFTNTAISPTSNVLSNPAASIVWKIETNVNGGRTIYNESTSKYVSFTGTSNNAMAVTSITGGSERWTFSYTSSLFTIANVTSTTRLLQYNTGSPRFACYTGSQQNITLYQMPYSIAPSITSSLTASANVGTAFNYTTTASGTPTSYAATGLPSGLSINTTTGVISGSPTTVGSSNVSLTATNATGTDTKTLVITVGQGSQTITFGTLAPKTYGNGDFTLNGASSSGLMLTYTSSNESVATISGNTVTIIGVGTSTITASQDGSANYLAATAISQTLTVNKSSQSITFGALPSMNESDSTFTLGATASSGLAVSYSSSNTSVITISGNTATIFGAGTTTITASQSGNENFDAATNVTQNQTVVSASLTNQTITFEALSTVTYGDASFTLSATSDSGLSVTYTSSDASIASISDNVVSIIKPGTVTITASQAGNSSFNAAQSITQNLLVNQKQLTVSNISVTDKIYDGSLTAIISTATLNGIVGTNDVVSLSNSAVFADANVGTGIAVTPNFTLNGADAGKYILSQPTGVSGNIIKANQTITFGALPSKTFGDATFNLVATGGASGNAVTFVSSNPAIASITGNTVTILAGGTVTITASQAGSLNYNDASDVTQSLVIAPKAQTISFFALGLKHLNDSSFDLTAVANSGATPTGLPITYVSSNTEVATISGSTVTLVGIGLTTITATQAGNDNYLPATFSQTLKVITPAIAAWNVNSLNQTATAAATTFVNLDATNNLMTRGLTAAASTGGASFRTTGFKNEGIATTNTDYFQVTLKPIENARLSIATIDATFNGTASYYANLGVTSQFAYSLDGTNFTLINSPVQSPSLIMATVDVSGISALQNVPSSSTVTLRYFASGQTTTGGWGFFSPTATSDAFSIGGQVKLNTTPSPLANNQDFCSSSTVASLVAEGTDLKWYATSNGGTPLTSDATLISGNYYVTQTLDGFESLVRTQILVTINGITSQPVSATICKVIGGTAVLSVVSANPNATYQWQTQAPTATLESTWTNVANPATGTAIYTGGTSSELTIRKSTLVLPITATKYRVKVTGSCNTADVSSTVTLTDAALPTEVVGAVTSSTSTSTGFAAATLAVGPYVGTSTTVSYRIPAFTGLGLTYYWTVPAGVSIVGQASGVTSVTQDGVNANANVLNVNFNDVSSGVGTVGSISVQAQNASGCKTVAKSVILTKALPAAPATLVMSNGVTATAITSFAKYMGTPTVLTLTAAASATATSYSWDLPAGVTQLTGENSNVITVNFAGVTSSNTDSYTTTAGVLTYVLRIGVKSINGVGNSMTANTALLNPITSSTAKLLTLTAVTPAAPTTLAMNNGTTTTSVTIVSKFIGTTTEFTLIAAASALASSYSWEIPNGVNVISGSDLTSNSIKVNFANVTQGTNSLYFGVKAVNGIGSSVTNNSALTIVPSTDSTAKLLKVTATVPLAPATLKMTNDAVSTSTAVTIISKFIGTSTEFTLTAATSALANTYSWEIPSTVNVVQGSNLTSNTIKVNFANVPAGTTSLVIGVKAVNGVGSSASANVSPNTGRTDKLLTLTATAPLTPATLVLNEINSATAVAVVSKYIETTTTLKLVAGTSLLANTYEWTLPTGVNRTNANGVSVDGLTSNDPFIYVNFANVAHENTTISLIFGVKAVNGFGSSSSVNVAPNLGNTFKLLTVTAGAPVAVATVGGSLSVCNKSEGYNYTITAPVGSVVSSTNGISGSTPNVLTTTDLTFNVVYSGTTSFPTTDKSLSIKSGNVFGFAIAKALALTKLATCPTTVVNNNSATVSKTIVAPFGVKAYPNPYASAFQLDFTTSSESQVEMRVYDMIGKLVEVRQFSTTEMNNQEVGNNYPSGIYNVIVTQGENVKTLRVIKR